MEVSLTWGSAAAPVPYLLQSIEVQLRRHYEVHEVPGV